jgi:spore maturation protein CgeB
LLFILGSGNFIFSGKGSGNQNVTDSIPLYDLHLTYHHGVKRRIQEEFNLPAAILPFGFDDDELLFRQCASQQEITKLCFLGNPDERRVMFIDALASKGIEIDVYGNGWSKFLNKPNIGIFQPSYGVEQWKVLRRYRAQLNLMRIHNDDSHNMRSFEVPGIGGIMVAPDTIDHRQFFENEKEVLLYSGVNDCAATVQTLFNWPKEKANSMRIAARERSIASKYSYRDRASQALAHMNRLLYGTEGRD